jgi:hypothetical protein
MASPKIADMKENIDHASIRCAMYSVLEFVCVFFSHQFTSLSVSKNGNDFLELNESTEKKEEKNEKK